LGQETVARIDALGHVNRLLAGLKINGPRPERGAALMDDDRVAGQITSAAYCPGQQAVVALALLRRAQAKPGTRLVCGSAEATVVKLPT
jgi:folate-binding Fe-S cluster repair protein YgfZ